MLKSRGGPNPLAPEGLQKALQAFTSGALPDAERLCRAVVASRPDLFDAWHLLGVVQSRLGKSAKAVISYDRAMAIRPDSFEALVNRGAAWHDLARYSQALADYDAALTLNPAFAPALTNRGVSLHALGRFEEAVASFDASMAARPNSPQALAHRGAALHELSRFDEALTNYDRALALRPADPETLYNRGVTLGRLRRFEEAAASFQRALALRPDDTKAYVNLGAALFELNRFGEALACFDAVLKTRPNETDVLTKSGVALHGLQRFSEAMDRFDRALAIRPDFVEALYHRGATQVSLKRVAAAMADFERTLATAPDHPHAFGAAANCALSLCDWEKRAKYGVELPARIEAGTSVVQPFTALRYIGDPALLLRCATNYARRASAPPPEPIRTLSTGPETRIRIAYVSANFNNHAVAYHIAELIERSDRARFEIIGLSLGRDDGSEIRHRLVSAFDQFHDVRGRSDAEIVKFARSLEIAIAVDLMGFTEDSRFEVFARRAAPIQVSYLGYPGSMGAACIDYILADATVIPVGHERFYREAVVRLPDCYQVNDSKRKIAHQAPTRAEVGLPASGFVFCCFNDLSKITPDMFDIWMRLLRQTDGSVLWLARDVEEAQGHLQRQAIARQVAPERLVFVDHVAMGDHLARHSLADLFLDTSPYNAHGTASAALWAGLPIVAWLGESFAGRVAASCLRAVGLPELIANNPQDYESLALDLAHNPARLRTVREQLQNNLSTHPLFDADRFRRRLEDAYLRMWTMWKSGQAPRSFDGDAI